MSRIRTQIDVPRRVLGKKHGLWTSAYHLIHPADGTSVKSNDSGDELLIYPSPYVDYPSDSANGISITQDGGIAAAGRIASGLTFESDCDFDYSNKIFCPPGVDCDDLVDVDPECADCEETVEYTPTYLTSSKTISTFQLQSSNPWARLERKMIKSRYNFVEQALWSGDGILESGEPMNLLNFVNLDPASSEIDGVTVEGDATNGETARWALTRLVTNMSLCLGDAAGMIHAPIDVVFIWMANDLLYTDIVDYGDGMGEREVLRTKIGGFVVVAGSGYTNIGPDGDTPAAGLKWAFGTSIVNLMWDKIEMFPEEGNMSHVRFQTNDLVVSATQLMGAFYDPCCTMAVLVDTDPTIN